MGAVLFALSVLMVATVAKLAAAAGHQEPAQQSPAPVPAAGGGNLGTWLGGGALLVSLGALVLVLRK